MDIQQALINVQDAYPEGEWARLEAQITKLFGPALPKPYPWREVVGGPPAVTFTSRLRWRPHALERLFEVLLDESGTKSLVLADVLNVVEEVHVTLATAPALPFIVVEIDLTLRPRVVEGRPNVPQLLHDLCYPLRLYLDALHEPGPRVRPNAAAAQFLAIHARDYPLAALDRLTTLERWSDDSSPPAPHGLPSRFLPNGFSYASYFGNVGNVKRLMLWNRDNVLTYEIMLGYPPPLDCLGDRFIMPMQGNYDMYDAARFNARMGLLRNWLVQTDDRLDMHDSELAELRRRCTGPRESFRTLRARTNNLLDVGTRVSRLQAELGGLHRCFHASLTSLADPAGSPERVVRLVPGDVGESTTIRANAQELLDLGQLLDGRAIAMEAEIERLSRYLHTTVSLRHAMWSQRLSVASVALGFIAVGVAFLLR